MKILRWCLDSKGCLAIDSHGKSGALVLFWDESIQVNLLSIEHRYIDVCIADDPLAEPWRATFVDGEPHVEDSHPMWEVLQHLTTRSRNPWVVLGILMRRDVAI